MVWHDGMTWDALLPLFGVLLGAGGSFAVQFLVTRASRAQARMERLASLRAERKEAVREFLEAAQLVEHLAERRFRNEDLDWTEAASATHRMWYLQKCIDLVCSPVLREATESYAWRMDEAVYRELPAGGDIWERLKELRDPFLEAARVELGVSDLVDEDRLP
ncbi:hypothetical protein ACIBSR_03280 [Streptomyces sp. NPDC049936]|uniref:hypothetical protein n=1 Tax=Streptomyces sp. NPDC049936 TaxID=3365599 RepID=UPI0037B74DCE